MRLEENIAHHNRYHGFAILHEAGAAAFHGNESFENEGAGFFLQGSQDNRYTSNRSHDNGLDGITMFGESRRNTFEGNELRDNVGYGVFSDTLVDGAIVADNTFANNARGETGSSSSEDIDWCQYTGFGPQGPCDPVFEGGPNLRDPQAGAGPTPTVQVQGNDGPRILSARIIGDPIYYPAMGDLWMPTWADDDRLYLSWGDGTGFADGYPVGYPVYENPDPITTTYCEEKAIYASEDEGYFPCWLWCNLYPCGADYSYPPAPLTDTGVLAFTGPVPEFTDVSITSIDVPTGAPFFLTRPDGALDVDEAGRNDKPASLLSVDGRLYFAGYSPAANPTLGYIAYSDDHGQTWTEAPGSHWSETNKFRIMMFINMGQDYALNRDGYAYALGFSGEAGLEEGSLYLARVPAQSIADYSAYEYFSRLDAATPQWSASQADAVPLENLFTVGQGSAMYHEGTDRYLFLTSAAEYAAASNGLFGYGALFEAPQPWGPWRKVSDLCFQPECDDGTYNPLWTDRDAPFGAEPGKYVPGLIPKDTGSNYVYFTIAGGNTHYQLQIGRLEFDTYP